MVDPELAGLIPTFVEEVCERLDRLTGCLAELDRDPEAGAVARRELHTIKGAARMMQLDPLAVLCHAAEEVLHRGRPGSGPILVAVTDKLRQMVDQLEHGEDPSPDARLLAALAIAATEGSEGPGAAPASKPSPSAPVETAPPAAEPGRGASGSAPPAAAVVRESPGSIVPPTAGLDQLAERATQLRILALGLHRTIERLHELAQLAERGSREARPAQILSVIATLLRRAAVETEGGQRRMAQLADAQIESLLTLELQPLRAQLHSLARHARELARHQGKELTVEIVGEDTRLDRRIVRGLEEALLHLIRNGVDHGIETPELREERGKPRAGHLRLEALSEGGRVRLAIADDGSGVDSEAVVERGVEAGLVPAAAAPALARDEILRLLFAPGFSTRREVSEISGRGWGLEAVATSVGRFGGQVALASEPLRGTTVTLTVPIAQRGEVVVLLRAGAVRLALPAAAVRRVLALSREQIVERDGRCLALLDGRLVPFVPLPRLFGQSEDGKLLLEGVSAAGPIALAVDSLEGSEEVLLRPFAGFLAHPLVEGMALLASGDPVAVLSPAALVAGVTLRALPSAGGAAAKLRPRRVLLVDDSLVTREMERRLLEDAGCDVKAVGDAAEALALLAEQDYDCLVTDIEMPGMDGFELTTRLRGLERFAHLPIVVVSTRDRPEDQLRGLRAGADAYLTKQGLDAGELIDLVRRLAGR